MAGFAKGGAKVSLSDKDGGTLLSYDVEAQIGGKLAQLGQRLINSAAKKTADDFFGKFAAAVRSRAERSRQSGPPQNPKPLTGRAPEVQSRLVPNHAAGQNRPDFALIRRWVCPSARKTRHSAGFRGGKPCPPSQ